ncbi:hypothetical protein Sipo8835_03680 [Streptomyces ipomoeae]|uniref:Uncharacterized protein n=1 Tax=Streptomyces ipomoeae TaxID=103232 RepID=A0A540QUP3_9ACTN|nr:hypothetical protein Sipo7851_45355 [Streptomyces ipomoeae]TQE24935.1 hypothetical protein SipoB123_17115 [Streptomyces ipomoeae]TQE38894.1 hypothetical protein Sipo8835_03680 [Streptomyces ipomoeae]
MIDRGRCETAAVARDHGFRCVQQMQGQMHVHAPEMDPTVPLPGHFFRPLVAGCRAPPDGSLAVPCVFRSTPAGCPTAAPHAYPPSHLLKTFHFCNRTSADRSDLVADCGP